MDRWSSGSAASFWCDSHAAEDAFQMAFLILARKASSLRRPELLSQWLHGVAVRTARKARWKQQSQRRREQMKEWSDDDEPIGACGRVEQHLIEREQAEALHQELANLPEKYRLPVLLCDLEGQTHQEVAQRLGWPVGTVSVRVSRARGLLRARLTRRGLAPAVGLLAAGAARESLAAPLPTALVDKTLEVVMSSLRRQAVSLSSVSTAAAGLAESILRIPAVARLRSGVVLCCAVAVGTFVGVSLARMLSLEDDLDARAAAFAAQLAVPITTPSSRPAAPADPAANNRFEADPGYYWAIPPYPAGPWSGGYNLFGAIPGQVIEVEDGSLIFTFGHRTDPRNSADRNYRPVVFDFQRKRYLPRWQRGASSASEQGDLASVDHFRLSPQILASDKVKYVGVERMRFETRRLTAGHVTGTTGPVTLPEPAKAQSRQFLSDPDYSWSIIPRPIGEGVWIEAVSARRETSCATC